MTKQTPPNDGGKGSREEINNRIATITGPLLWEDRAIVHRSGGKITEEQYQEALFRLACGEMMATVTADLGLSRSALLVRAGTDEEFGRILKAAQTMGTSARLENAESALWGKEPYTTGNVQRDKALAEHARWMASRLDRETYGDKITHDVRSLNITVVKDDGDIL